MFRKNTSLNFIDSEGERSFQVRSKGKHIKEEQSDIIEKIKGVENNPIRVIIRLKFLSFGSFTDAMKMQFFYIHIYIQKIDMHIPISRRDIFSKP